MAQLAEREFDRFLHVGSRPSIMVCHGVGTMVSNETLNNVKSRHAPMIAKRNKQLLAIPGMIVLVILNASNGDN